MSQDQPAGPQSDIGSGAPRRVLVVDDEAGLCELASLWLEALGCEVATAQSAAQALEQLARSRFDVLFSDVVMPGSMDGVDLAREALRRWPHLQLILATGYSWREIGALDFPVQLLNKPYRKADLARVLATASGLAGLTPPA